jgi:hypothetical protein
MIYKFETKHSVLEIELSKAEDEEKDDYDTVMISVKYSDMLGFVTKSLSKKEVYNLIGALHLLHKEMK